MDEVETNEQSNDLHKGNQSEITKINTKKKIRWDVAFLILLCLVVFGGLAYLFRDRLDINFGNPLKKSGGIGVFVTLGSEKMGDVIDSDKGGELEVSSNSGGNQKLVIDPGTLITSTEFAIEKIENIDGLPEMVSFLSGVHIEADPLLKEPIELRISVPQGIKLTELAGFSYEAEGEDWHLYPIEIVGDEVLMKVNHFSGYGLIVVSGDFTDLQEPDSVRAKAEQNLANLLREEMMAQYTGERNELNDDVLSRLTNILRVWYKTGVKKYLDQAGSNEEIIMIAAKEYLSWLSMVQLMGVEDRLGNEIVDARSLLTKAFEYSSQKLYARCKDELDATQASRLMQLAALVQNMGGELGGNINANKIIESAQKCAQFKLRISTVLTQEWTGLDCEEITKSFSGEIELLPDEDMNVSGEGVISGKANYCQHPCWLESGDYDQIVRVPQTKVEMSKGKPEISLLLEIPEEEGNKMWCEWINEDSVHGTLGSDAEWDEVIMAHDTERLNWELMKITNWEILGKGGIYARKIYDQQGVSTSDWEKTTFELVHTPK